MPARAASRFLRVARCSSAALLLRYYCLTTALLLCLQMLRFAFANGEVLVCCFTTASLLLYYCFTTVLLLFYYCVSAVPAGGVSLSCAWRGARLLLYYCFTTALLLLYYSACRCCISLLQMARCSSSSAVRVCFACAFNGFSLVSAMSFSLDTHSLLRLRVYWV